MTSYEWYHKYINQNLLGLTYTYTREWLQYYSQITYTGDIQFSYTQCSIQWTSLSTVPTSNWSTFELQFTANWSLLICRFMRIGYSAKVSDDVTMVTQEVLNLGYLIKRFWSFLFAAGLTCIAKRTQVLLRSRSASTPPLRAARPLAAWSWTSCSRKLKTPRRRCSTTIQHVVLRWGSIT